MKVMCIDNNRRANELTIGKWYNTIPTYRSPGQGPFAVYYVINDLGVVTVHDMSRFKAMDIIRDEKLKQLGI